MNNNQTTTTRLDQIDGLVSLPKTTMEAQQLLLHSSGGGGGTRAAAAGAKRKINDLINNGMVGGEMDCSRRTPTKTTPFCQAPSTRPPRWNDLEVS